MKSAVQQSEHTTDVLRFRVGTVTGSQDIPFEVGLGASVSSVVESIAARMQLPSETPWALRDDDTSVYLDDSIPLSEQIAPDSRLRITPRSHLGG